MELFLNILWAVIALAALGVWRYQWKRQERVDAREPWQQWTAFACALVFVFFAVSLSDDLQAAAILADDCMVGRHHSLTWNRGCASNADDSATHVSLAAGPAAPSPGRMQIVARIVPAGLKISVIRSLHTIDPRGPPTSPL